MKNAFMIAATGSGCGKTTITCGVLMALRERGLKCRSFKTGPDYIDPMFHSEIIGVPSKNLDLFFTDSETTRGLFLKGNVSDVSVVEGVMGLYDGISPISDDASSYALACALDIPIILIVDAKGMGRSVVAVIKGFLDMDREKRIAGVILNRMSSGYYDKIKNVIEDETGVRVLGHFPVQKNGTIESRYLGLKLPTEVDDLKKKAREIAEILEETVDIDGILEISKVSDNLVISGNSEISCDLEISKIQNDATSIEKKIRIAVARDEAFCFYYEDNLQLLKDLGAELVDFSPIHDSKLPSNIDGIILGGGYPELYAETLSSNKSMIASIKEALEVKKIPSLAECGGFMYLHEEIETEDGSTFPMTGIIKGKCFYKGHLVRFGYVEVNKTIKGHEFHYFDSDNNGSDLTLTKASTGTEYKAGFVADDHIWAFAHLYYPSNPEFPKRFIEKCRNRRGN